MANFSLSPAVTVREVNLTGYVPNIPSAKTGMILRANSGPCMDVTPITNETDLVTIFGKPTAANFQDFYQAWNFLQYASSLYVVRPIDQAGATKNAGIGITGDTSSNESFSNFYNSAVAQNSLENLSGQSESLYFINKDVTSDQRLAVAISSSPSTFKKQIGLEYYANISNAISSPTVTATGATTLTNGSQVILNGNKLATVLTTSQTDVSSSTIKFDRNITTSDVDAFYAVGVTATGLVGTFKKEGFTFKLGTKVKTDYVVASIDNDPASTDNYLVTFTNFGGSASIAVSANEIVSSSDVKFSGNTAYNTTRNDFGISAGDTSISLQPGFIIEAGTQFTLSGISNTYTVASVDYVLNKINLISPSPSATASASASITLTITQPTIDKIVTGINYFDKVYDTGLIVKTRKKVFNPAGTEVTVIAQSLVPFSAFYDYPPNYTNGEFNVVVLRKNDDGFYEKYEAHTVSYDELAKNNNGTPIFVETVFNKTSKALYAKVGLVTAIRPETANIPIPKIVGDTSTIYPTKVLYGSTVYDATNYTAGDIEQAYTLFADPESFDINIIQCHQLDTNYASTIAETRKDCIAVVAPYDYQVLSTSTANDCTSYLLDNFGSQTEFDSKIFTAFGTYSAFYGNMKYQYDKFNNVNRWINIAGDVAGLYAQTDRTNDPWWASAGTTRGIIKNAIKLAFNPNKQNRDELYVNSINPIMSIPGEGNAVVWGQKTATATPSAMDRVNVRRLLIHLEKSIATASNIGIFEFNDAFTRSRLFNILDPFLRSVKARRGLYEYKLVIDESNNTSEIIDQNGLVIDIYLQPTKVAEFIRVTAAVIPTGATFSEFVGSF